MTSMRGCAVPIVLLVPLPSQAHHTFATHYDASGSMEFEGVVASLSAYHRVRPVSSAWVYFGLRDEARAP